MSTRELTEKELDQVSGGAPPFTTTNKPEKGNPQGGGNGLKVENPGGNEPPPFQPSPGKS